MTGPVAIVTIAVRGTGAAVARRVHWMTAAPAGTSGRRQLSSHASRPALPGPAETRLPAGFTVQLADGVHRSRDGKLLLGGSPARLLRLTPAAVRLLGPGSFTVTDRASAVLGRRLLDSGIVAPRPPACPVRDITIVVPVLNRTAGLDRLLARLKADPDSSSLPCLVVDDGSANPGAVATVARRYGAGLIRHTGNRGPAAARNTGIRLASTSYIAFCDSDVLPQPGWLGSLIAQFADPAVALAAPRVLCADGFAPRWLERFESVRSPLDMGDNEAPVLPLSPVAYVPGAVMVVRKTAIAEGFAPELRFGEDVDLCMRLQQAGWRLRYVPGARVTHEPRADLGSWLAQQAQYGSSAADLALRHPGLVPPLYAAPWAVAACGLLLRGRPVSIAIAGALFLTAAARLARLMPDADTPARAAALLTVATLRSAGEQVGCCATRHHWPLAVLVAVVSKRARRMLLAYAVFDGLRDYQGCGRPQGLLVHLLLRRLADLAYGTGVWAGAARRRTVAPLVPRFAGVTLRVFQPVAAHGSGQQACSTGAADA